MKRFDISACAISIATAMVTTIRSGDDYSRMAQLSKAEGYDKVSDWIAKNAVGQSIALASHLEQARVECPELFDQSSLVISEEATAELKASGKSAVVAKSDLSPKDTPLHVENASVSSGEGLTNTSGEEGTSSATDAGWQLDAAEVFGGKSADTAAATVAPPTSVTASIAPEPEKNDIPLVPAPPAEVPAATTSTNTTMGSVTPAGVELDSEGIPWDGRIHSSSKKKLVENGRWKLIRGIDKDYVDEIKAELLSGLAAPVPAPVEPSQTQGLQISNFAQLMAAITSAGLKPDQINPVIQSLGIAAMPVLATRPDLIPAVALALGL